MPQKKKKGNNNNNKVIKTITFGKKKIKVGKVLKKANVTDTRIKTKQIILLEQLKANENTVVLSHRGLTLNDLCRRMGHYNECVVRDAIIETKTLLTENADLIGKNLRMIMPCVGRLISAGLKDEATKNQLKSLLRTTFVAAPSELFSSHFGLFVTHVLTAITDIRLPTKHFAFEVLILLLRHYPELCSTKAEIFDRYLEIMGSDRRPKNQVLVSESISLIRSVYEKRVESSLWESSKKIELSIDDGKCSPQISLILPLRKALYFPILYNESNDVEHNAERLEKLNTIISSCNIRQHPSSKKC